MSSKKQRLFSQETRKIRKILNEEARLGLNTNSDSETEEVDLKQEIYPLGHYINDREEMIEQMFSLIKGPKLERMLPPILKDMPLDELKADCLIHLLGMSKKRIVAVLDGKEINSSSESELEPENSPSPKKKRKSKFTPINIKQEGCSDVSNNSEEVVLVDPGLEDDSFFKNKTKKQSRNEETKNSKKSKKRKKDVEKNKSRSTKKLIVKPERDVANSPAQEISSDGEDQGTVEAPKEGKTLLEILELEMRARAIRALLTKGDNTVTMSEESTSKESSTVVDNEEENEIDSNKITPARNFRKQNKDKGDDIILVAPKVVTIDLTDETEALGAKKVIDAEHKIEELDNLLSSVASEQAEVELDKSKIQAKNIANEEQKEANKNSDTIDKSPVIIEEIALTENDITDNEQSDASDEDEVISITDSPKNNQTENMTETQAETEEQKSDWARRWLESDKVKKVVKTSKICGTIRKRIKSAKLAKKSEPPKIEEQVTSNPFPPEIEGRVEEYAMLTKSQANLAGGHRNESSESTNNSGANVDQQETSNEQVQDISSTKVDTLTEKSLNVSDSVGQNETVDSALGTSVNSSAQNTSGEVEYSANDVIVDSTLSTQSNLDLETRESLEAPQAVNKNIDSTNENLSVPESEIERLAISEDSNNSTAKVVKEATSADSASQSPLQKVPQDSVFNESVGEEVPPKCPLNNEESGSISQNSSSNQLVPKIGDIADSENKEIKASVAANEFVDYNEPETLEISIDDDDSDFE